MPNKWISHVKDFASKNGINYRDALKDPKCKAAYRKGSTKSKRGGAGDCGGSKRRRGGRKGTRKR
jgi:hypothetical protein